MNQHLQQFAQQLATWTEAIIEHGRTPFRRVDTYPDIDTEQGVIQPPLVFWINRQSMMAGGILLLPENNLEGELERGRNCASALGLRHFVTWEVNQVRIWQIENDETVEKQSHPLSSPSHPETFRYLLADILDALKLLSVLGAVPANDLSSCYFNNLFQITLQQALSPLIGSYRRQRSETGDHLAGDADTCANEANRLLLLQVLSLLWFNKFPDTFLPEKLERAIELSLPGLPEDIQKPLSLTPTLNPPPLPLETAVCFHHLLLRLRQLSWAQPENRVKACILRLIEYWYQDKTEIKGAAAIHLYPTTPPLSSSTTALLSNSPSFLAATALLTNISALPHNKLFLGNLFQFDQNNFSTQPVFGRLLNHAGISSPKRQEYTARLRAAWPNRYLKIKTGEPFWLWELIHLLGISHAGQNLTLELPSESLTESKNKLAWPLLYDNFIFKWIKTLNNGNVQISISRSKISGESFDLQRGDEVRRITPVTDLNCFRSQLLFALTLPAEIYKLLEDEFIWPEQNKIPDDQLSGWKIYTQSRLYKWFKSILQNETSLASPEDAAEMEAIYTCVPYPEPLLLNSLTSFGQRNSKESLLASIDHFLANLLACPTIEKIEPQSARKISKTGTEGASSGKKIRATIEEQLSVHGIPNFPEQYLYFLDHPEMVHYTITPPLKLKSSLLGQFELEDTKGQIIAGYGKELEQILLFCSESGKTEIDLPSDRYQLEELLNYYQKDLRALYKYLDNLCYSQVENSKSAHKLTNNIWKNLALPAPSWFKN